MWYLKYNNQPNNQGTFIRLAYADHIKGPYQMFLYGTLQLSQTPFRHDRDETAVETAATGGDYFAPHIASPHVVVDNVRRELVMFFHGLEGKPKSDTQISRYA